MVTIEEMKAYKAEKELKDELMKTAYELEVRRLERKVEAMKNEVLELIEYGTIARQSGLLPSYREYRKKYADYVKNAWVYTDGIYHRLGFVADSLDEKIVAIGIDNGGACGRFDLHFDMHGRLRWLSNSGDCHFDIHMYDGKSDRYKKCLEKFIMDFEWLKQKVYALVEENMKEGE